MTHLRRTLILSTALTACVASLALACGNSDTGAGKNPYHLIQPDVLTVAAMGDQKPFAYSGAHGESQGFAVDLINEIARRRHLQTAYQTTDMSGLLTGLTIRRYDIGAAALSPTPERRKNVDFAKPLYWGYNAVLTKRDSTEHSIADFNGKKVGVTLGSVQEAWAKKHMPKAEIIQFRDVPAAVSQLQSGAVDALALGGTVAEDLLKEHTSLHIAVEKPQDMGASLPLPKGSALRSAVDTTMAQMVKDGTYMKLYRKWLPKAPRKELIEVWPDLADQVNATPSTSAKPTAPASATAPGKS